nr:hypothetical protein [Hepelivirales sp.]
MLVASPIISAVIYGDVALTDIAGAKAIYVFNQDEDTNKGYIYVLNNKLGFLADVDTRYMVTPKEDFRRFRMVSGSMMSQWSGPEIFKAGVQVTARITDKEDLKDFEPNEKPDNIISNVSEVLVTTCQHSNPVFEFSETDRNNDNSGGTFIDPEIEDAAIYNHELTFNKKNLNNGTFTFPELTLDPGKIPAATTGAATFLANIAAKMWAVMNSSNEHVFTSKQIIDAYQFKYPSFVSEVTNQSKLIYSINYKMKFVIKNLATNSQLVNTFTLNNTVADSNSKFFIALLQSAESFWTNNADLGIGTNRVPVNFSGQDTYNVDVSIVLELPLNGRHDYRVVVPRDITAALSRNMIGETPFYDDNFLQPVTSVSIGNESMKYSAQYQTTHIFEFVLNDTTVLGTAAVAHAPNDPDTTVSKQQFDKFQKVMKGMPPALIMNDAGMTRTTVGQLRSRGVLGQLTSLVAPLMSLILPGSRPYLNAIGQTSDAIDNFK